MGKPFTIEQGSTKILEECLEATARFSPFASPHEGYAIIKEELDELWGLVKLNAVQREDYAIGHDGTTFKEALSKEAMQIGAMALRFMVDLA